MANNNRGNNQNQGGGGGGKGGGGDSNKITLSANISGPRNNCKIGAMLRKGRIPIAGETVMMRFGTSDRPYGGWMLDPSDTAKRLTFPTNPDGEVETMTMDLSSDVHKGFTQVMVVCYRNSDASQGIYESVVQLPPIDAADGPKPTKPVVKRLQIQFPEGVLKSGSPSHTWPMLKTVGADGKPSAEDLIFLASAPVTLTDLMTGDPLEHNGLSAEMVDRFEYKTPSTGFVLIVCRLEGALECNMKIVHKATGEMVEIKMEFDY